MEKKVLLVNPYNTKSDHIQPPLGLAFLATASRNAGFDVSLLDANKKRMSFKKFKSYLKRNTFDFIGFQLYTANLNYVKQALDLIKKINPSTTTVVGGPHPSALPEKIFKQMGDCLDFAFRGEVEIGFPLLLKYYKKTSYFKNIPGLIYRDGIKIIANPPLFFHDLDQLGLPSWDLIRPQTYPEAQHGAFFKKFPIAPIITTRGCPYNCGFCGGKLNTGRVFRKRSVEDILKEIRLLYQKYKIREFHIVDDNFTLDADFAKKLLEGIKKLNLKASFAVPNGVRLNTLDDDLLKLMREVGFYIISVGIESGSNRILKEMNKLITVKEIEDKIKLINKYKIPVAGFFILGYPGETEKEIKKTINFSLKLKLLRANYFLFLPLPGTPIYKKLEKEKLIPEDIQNWSFNSVKSFSGVSTKKLKKYQRQAFLRFYLLRPKTMIRNILCIRRPRQIIFLLTRALRWVF